MTCITQPLSASLLTDFYQLSMAYGFWKAKMDQHEAVFHMHFRRPPFEAGLAVSAGLASLIDVLAQYRFEDEDISFLKELRNVEGNPYFCSEFLKYLKNLTFNWDIDAIEEGEVVFPYEPLVRVRGPLIECQLIESLLLNIINYQTLIASKAARIYIAAEGAPVIEFGFRRAQGIDGAVSASRAAYIGGCSGTSNVMAGKLFDIPIRGTQAHSWILAFDDELEAFETFAKTQPENCLFLVDTYNSIKGIQHAIAIGHKLKQQGKKLLGIRLDSGDLAYLSIKARTMLDEAGFKEAMVFASNELDETIIRDLIQQGAQVSVWGVGTSLITSKGQSALDGVYKISAIRKPKGEWQYRLKISEQMRKTTNPGILQVRRFESKERFLGDIIYDELTPTTEGWEMVDPHDQTKRKWFDKDHPAKNLLVPIFRKGQVVYQSPNIHQMRKKMIASLPYFHKGLKRFLFPHQYPVGLENNLYQIRTKLIETIRRSR